MQGTEQRRRLHLGISLVVFALSFVSVLLISANLMLQDLKLDFLKERQRLELSVNEIRQSALNLLDAAAAAYQSLDSFDNSRLATITGNLMAAHPSFELVAYASWVPESDRESFIEDMQEAGFYGYRLRSQISSRLMQDSIGSLPIKFVEPYSPRNVVLLGQDLLQAKQDTEVFEWLLREGRANLLEKWTLPTFEGKGIFLARPTYRGLFVPSSVSQRLFQGDGVFLLLLNFEGLLEEVNLENKDIRITLASSGDNAGQLDAGKVALADLSEGALLLQDGLSLFGSTKQLHLHMPVSWQQLFPMVTWWLALLVAAGSVYLYRMYVYRLVAKESLRIKELVIQEERRRAQGTLHSLADAVLVFGRHGKLMYMNPVAKRLLGLDPESGMEESTPDRLLQFVDAETGKTISDTSEYLEELADGKNVGDVMLVTPNEGLVAVDNRISQLHDGDGGVVMVMRDVRVERELTSKLEYQATHDTLTGLFNRNAFEATLKLVLDGIHQSGETHALLLVDLDRFKLVNDTAGHQAGDELLKAVAGVLSAAIRKDDVLARMGGDEFAILLHGRDIDEAADIATRLRRSLENLRFMWSDLMHEVRASVGVVPITPDSGSLVDVMAHVDLACHAAKEAGRNVIHVYRPDDDVVKNTRAQMEWLSRLQEAIEEGRFELYRQPMVRTEDVEEPPIYEFLLRMRDAHNNEVAPGSFLPSAERYGMMCDIDRWVIGRAFELMADPRYMPPESVCTINLSGQSLSKADLYSLVCSHQRKTGVSPARVCFEITETAAISNLAAASDLLALLRADGYRVMLDDFGSGMSSFGYLNKLKVDFIKIDGQFVVDVVRDPLAATMVRAVCEIAVLLGIKTVAEKIESADVLEQVTEIGVDYVQGYLIQRPEPVRPDDHYLLQKQQA
jgi:diguanylate cyclase (GGDEF)-like protein